jgi:hypothetical protein
MADLLGDGGGREQHQLELELELELEPEPVLLQAQQISRAFLRLAPSASCGRHG